MKSPSTSPILTMTIVKALLTMLLFSSATPTTMACRCAFEPTLELELQDETTSIFRGMIVPSLHLSSTTINKEFRVVIEKVYQNGAVPLRAYQTITVVTPRNSCGVPSLPLFSTFLFSGVVVYKSGIVPFNDDRNLMFQPEQELPMKETDTTDTESKPTYQLRRTQSTETTTGSTASVSMSVHLCAYYKPWRIVTRKEKCQLEHSVICN